VAVLYGGLGISNLKFLIKKISFFSACAFSKFMIIKAMDPVWIRIGIPSEVPDPDSMNADMKHWNSDQE
jgi:hypothetical protein